jgi:hypothetical protein
LSIESKLSKFRASLVISNSNSVLTSVSARGGKEEEEEEIDSIVSYRLFKSSVLFNSILLTILYLTSVILLSSTF